MRLSEIPRIPCCLDLISRRSPEQMLDGPGRPDRVFKELWNGEDIIQLPEPASLIVSERLRQACALQNTSL